jgi:hypothetical protein
MGDLFKRLNISLTNYGIHKNAARMDYIMSEKNDLEKIKPFKIKKR